jgi:DNA polymerase-3 subunit epsilon
MYSFAPTMRGAQHDVCGCFPTGRHYPGIADLLSSAFGPVEGLWEGFDPLAPWTDLPIAVIDFETTGFDENLDRVVEIGVACFHKGQLTQTKSWLIQPGMPIPESAVSVHGITDAMVADAPRFEQVADELRQLLVGHLPAAYNATFDRKFMHAEMKRAAVTGQLPAAVDPRVVWVDPLVWVRELMADEKSKRLGDVCEKLGIPLSDAHRAWADAEAAGRVLVTLSERMPRSYADLIRIQDQYAARQEAELADWRRRRN